MKSVSNTICEIINYSFKNDFLLEEALTHPSLNKRNSKNQIECYERLEFLGDSILNMIVSGLLFKLFPNEREGALAKRKMDLICGSTVANIAKEIKLGDFIRMNNSEHFNGGKHNLKNLENALEALIGAIYIDGGFRSAEKFVTQHWERLAKNMLIPPQDPKTSLQEWTQKNKLPLPEYELTKQTGPAHSPKFTISIKIENYGEVSAQASSKKVAEQRAAELILKKINNTKKTIQLNSSFEKQI